eukprot:217994-Prymnesium_polylepis.1
MNSTLFKRLLGMNTHRLHVPSRHTGTAPPPQHCTPPLRAPPAQHHPLTPHATRHVTCTTPSRHLCVHRSALAPICRPDVRPPPPPAPT